MEPVLPAAPGRLRSRSVRVTVKPYSGERVLLVEDEPILAMSVEDMLADLGCRVIGPALSVGQAEALARQAPLDAALLDINMGDTPSFSVAEILRERRVPFGFVTGYGRCGVPSVLDDAPVLQKPYTQASLAALLQRLLR